MADVAPQLALPITCFDPPAIIAAVKEKYGEVPAQAGVTADGKLAILFVNPNSQSWTLALQLAAEKMCVVGGGKSWEQIGPPPGDPA